MRRLWIAAVTVVVAAVAGSAVGAPMEPPINVANVGLATPESILYDVRDDVYLVSNINGNPTGFDDNGFISRIAPDGHVLELKWIDGERPDVTLNAPKGMALTADALYVADINAVRIFDRRSGGYLGAVVVLGATFVNDLAAGPGRVVYATDTGLNPDFSPSGTDAIYKIDAERVLSAVIKTPDLHNPNGVTVLPGGDLFVVTFAPTGEVYAIAGGAIRNVRRMPSGGLDGVEAIPGGAFLISSWGASAVFQLQRDGSATTVVSSVPSPADIGYDNRRDRVLIPIFTENRLVIQPLR